MSDLDAPPPTSGSDAAPPDDGLTCEVCGRHFRAKIALFNHRRTHQRDPAEGLGVEPEIKVKRAVKPTQKELAEIQAEMAANVKSIGQILHPILINLKLLKLQNPDGRVTVPGTAMEFGIPSFETHLAYTVISRSDVTAAVVMQHAAANETLLKWVMRFNSWFKGGEVGQLVGAHVVAAVASVGVENPMLGAAAGLLIPDVLEQVQVENHQLRQQVEQLRQQVAAGVAGDERGAGN